MPCSGSWLFGIAQFVVAGRLRREGCERRANARVRGGAARRQGIGGLETFGARSASFIDVLPRGAAVALPSAGGRHVGPGGGDDAGQVVTGHRVIGPPQREDLLLALAAQLGRALPWAQRLPAPPPSAAG